jgi:hypothetical protein
MPTHAISAVREKQPYFVNEEFFSLKMSFKVIMTGLKFTSKFYQIADLQGIPTLFYVNH